MTKAEKLKARGIVPAHNIAADCPGWTKAGQLGAEYTFSTLFRDTTLRSGVKDPDVNPKKRNDKRHCKYGGAEFSRCHFLIHGRNPTAEFVNERLT